MKVLISSIGSRGEVQPIIALALELHALGHESFVCVPPNFKAWVESFGLTCIPVGPDVQKFASRSAEPNAKRRKPSKAQWRKIIGHTVGEQFQVLGAAARDCALLVARGGLQSAARSIAETQKIPYVYVAYCAGTLPSSAHPPPMIRSQSLPTLVNQLLWKKSEWRWNNLFRTAVNEQRAALDLRPVKSVPRYIFTSEPWLAADAVLGPAAPAAGLQVMQTGAWLLRDPTPLQESVEQFLAAGEAPLYFGFGSMQAAPDTSRVLVETALRWADARSSRRAGRT